MLVNRSTRRFAGIMARVTLLGAAALPVLAAAIWIYLDFFGRLAMDSGFMAFDPGAVGLSGRLAGFVVSLAGAGLQVWSLLCLRKTFQEAADGRALSAVAVFSFRRFAWISLAMVFVGIAQHTGYVAIVSMSDPDLPNQIAIRFGSGELKSLLIALLFVFAAQVFAAGREAQEENAAFL
jgi:hypothetical protein